MVGAGSSASLLASPSRVQLLHLLQQGGRSTIDVLARATGLHQNTVREHLARLAEGGFVVSEPEVRSTRGRPRIVYRATRAADVREDPEAARRLERAIAQAALTSALVRAFGPDDHSGAAERAGREVGAALSIREIAPTQDVDAAPPDRELLALEAHLDGFGFDPVLVPGDLGGGAGDGRSGEDRDEQRVEERATFELWRCPFLALALERPDVVCSVHAGLAQGVLDQAGTRWQVDRLTPFVSPEHCTLALRRRHAGP